MSKFWTNANYGGQFVTDANGSYTKSELTDNVKRAIQGNEAMQAIDVD